MDTKVSKSGDTMTGDLLIKKNDTARLSLTNLSRDSAVNPENWGGFGTVNFFDKNNVQTGLIENWQFEDGRLHMLIRVINRGKVAQMLVGVNANGSVYTECPASSINNSIVTTVSRGSNYVRFGNGIQICWGYAGSNEQLITFPQPFKDTNYSITVTGGNIKNEAYPSLVRDESKTSTSVKIYCQCLGKNYIVIGYWY